jgi:Xaa-Pro aminopeptidase
VWDQLRTIAPDATGILVTSLVNVRYLTGFTGSNAVLMLGDSGELLGTDGRYAVQAGEQCADLPVILDRMTLPAVVAAWGERGPVAIESEHLSVGDLRTLEPSIRGRILETTGVVESVRMIKEPDEIAAIQRACRISDEALQTILPRVRPGVTERDVARWLESAMFDHGADELSFATIVAAGPHSAKPHHEPTTRPIMGGDILLIDFGAAVDGYHADETRTFVLGQPAEWQSEIHGIVARAQVAGCEAAVAGAGLRDVDAAARDVVAAAGYAEYFDHGLGHGVGLQIHEAPFFSTRATGMLPAGSPVTIEPGIYLPDRGGVRVEDTILVGEGPSRPLTRSPRDLVALG